MQMILTEFSELKGKRKHEGRKGAHWEGGIPWKYEADNYENSGRVQSKYIIYP